MCIAKRTICNICIGRQNLQSHKSCIFLRKEIPVRLANIMNEINLLPQILLDMPSVKQVVGWLVINQFIAWYSLVLSKIIMFESVRLLFILNCWVFPIIVYLEMHANVSLWSFCVAIVMNDFLILRNFNN